MSDLKTLTMSHRQAHLLYRLLIAHHVRIEQAQGKREELPSLLEERLAALVGGAKTASTGGAD
jgi:hypothetical protein